MNTLRPLLADVRTCSLCADLPHSPRPVVQISSQAQILIAGQAPGRRVHESGVPFDDPSGIRLRNWMNVSKETFYDPEKIAILPMGFCYPGTGSRGDLPPRPECAPAWREQLLSHASGVNLTLVIGLYAQAYHFEGRASVTERVRDWETHWPEKVPMPHPSPRNNLWLRRNPWFETDLLPQLQDRLRSLLAE